MRRYLLSLTPMAVLALLLSQPVAAQDKEKDKEKSKLNDNEEIVIKRKGDKDSKVTIEIKGDEVTVNGKPLDEYDDDNIVIRKKKGYAPHSPFTGGNGAFNFDDNFRYGPGGSSAFLGVFTDKSEKGAKVQEVTEGSAADKAGLKEGDIITKIDDAAIAGPDELTKTIRKHKPEDKVTITYERNGKTEKTTATLGKRKSMSYHFESPRIEVPNFEFDFNMPPGNNFGYGGRARLGIKAQDTEEGKGAKVLDVDDESPADKAGIKEDDVITEFDGKKVNTAGELADAAREAREKPSVKITFNRNGKSQTVEVKTPKKLRTANL
jgi:serine protease Do